MSKNSDEKPDNLFRQSLIGVRPIHHDQAFTEKTKEQDSELLAEKRLAATQAIPKYPQLLADTYVVKVKAEEYLQFFKPGLPRNMLSKLRNGKLAVDYRLDLHGYTIEQAYENLENSINRSYEADYRCIHVIHGKGKSPQYSILKSHINSWLKQMSKVLAFCSAANKDGGRGAVYVLIKRKRN